MSAKATQFKVGTSPGPGRPKGVKNKTTNLKGILFDLLDKNKDSVTKKLEEMLRSHRDFKWVIGLVASLEPKDVKLSGEVQGTNIVINLPTNGDKPKTRFGELMSNDSLLPEMQ